MLKYIKCIKIPFSLIAIEISLSLFFFFTAFETLNAQRNGLEFIKLVKELKSVHEPKPNLECQGSLVISPYLLFIIPNAY